MATGWSPVGLYVEVSSNFMNSYYTLITVFSTFGTFLIWRHLLLDIFGFCLVICFYYGTSNLQKAKANTRFFKRLY